VPSASLDYWMSRLRQHQVLVEDAGPRFGEPVVRLADPDGLPLELVATVHADPSRAWRTGPVASEHAIGGVHSATLSVEGYEETAKLLADVMGLEYVGTENNRYRYTAASSEGPGSIVDVLCAPDGRFGRPGAGTVHPIAWRTPDDAQQVRWRSYYGPVDLTDGYRNPPTPDPLDVRSIEAAFLGGTPDEVPDRYREASPITYVSRALPPSLLIYGGRDHVVLPRFGAMLDGRLHVAGARSVFEIPWAERAFDAIPNGPSGQLSLYYTERFLAWALTQAPPDRRQS
jgi:catechol 2,3-dioxygenase-like lactoylglutathione lyase family enzyme